jgi:hypothetical protein
VVVGVLILLWLVAFVLLVVFTGHHTSGGYTPRPPAVTRGG